jgi:hypothetical protein
MHGPGSLTERTHTAASNANGTTTPSVKEMEAGRMAALLAGTVVYNAFPPSCGRPLTRLTVCLGLSALLHDAPRWNHANAWGDSSHDEAANLQRVISLSIDLPDYAIAFLEALNVGPNFEDHACHVASEHCGPLLDEDTMVLHMPVERVDCNGGVLHDDLASTGRG